MSGYIWAKTPEGALFVVLMVDGRGYVPGLENAINMADVFTLGPVQWPEQLGFCSHRVDDIKQHIEAPRTHSAIQRPQNDPYVAGNVTQFRLNAV